MKAKKTLSAILLTFSLSMFANPFVTVMGESVNDEITQITFNGDNAHLRFKSGKIMTEDIEDVVVSFSSATSLGTNTSVVYVLKTIVGDRLNISGLNGENIEIFNIKGICLQSLVADYESVSIDVSNLSNGVYFLRVGNRAIKFVKE